MRFVVHGLMLIVDASCLYAVLMDEPEGSRIRARLAEDPELHAPHVIDVEVFGIIRRDFRNGLIDATMANQALDEMRDWPGERHGHRLLLERAWELRDNVRGWDAMYVALAESLEGTLITGDQRLARAPGLQCLVEVISEG